ncbi:Retrotransposon gag domain-containing protein [Hirschfeldia incana]|nr:Retrotransposon gag domain-containing protein [Hirschfeldia incana]
MSARKQMLLQADGSSTDSLMESMTEVQTTMSQLHSSVAVLIDSMSEILKSMTEMKTTLQQHPTTTAEQDPLDTSAEEKKEKPRHIYTKRIEVEMPSFDGNTQTLNHWIIKAERYFEFGDFTEKEKITISSLSFDGPALNWFVATDRLNPFTDWEDFKTQLVERFGHSECAITRLLQLEQVGSVVEYLSEFEEIASELPKSEDRNRVFLEGVFVKGLKDEIKDMLRLFEPKGLKEIIAKARTLENTRLFWGRGCPRDD